MGRGLRGAVPGVGRVRLRHRRAAPGRRRPVGHGRLTTPADPPPGIVLAWRAPLPDEELLELVESHGGHGEAGWWDRIRPHSLGWVTARDEAALLVGFVNVAWDGGDHAFLIDTKTRGDRRRRGIATAVVARAVQEARAAGCEWLHVDFRDELAPFYFDACGFRPTLAGVIRLR